MSSNLGLSGLNLQSLLPMQNQNIFGANANVNSDNLALGLLLSSGMPGGGILTQENNLLPQAQQEQNIMNMIVSLVVVSLFSTILGANNQPNKQSTDSITPQTQSNDANSITEPVFGPGGEVPTEPDVENADKSAEDTTQAGKTTEAQATSEKQSTSQQGAEALAADAEAQASLAEQQIISAQSIPVPPVVNPPMFITGKQQLVVDKCAEKIRSNIKQLDILQNTYGTQEITPEYARANGALTRVCNVYTELEQIAKNLYSSRQPAVDEYNNQRNKGDAAAAGFPNEGIDGNPDNDRVGYGDRLM
ncbi:MAG TPA: hypothetical protein P5556_00425 [Candidatus Gastranaerophilales bacterium]|nr:hypothetical protein [Candidatus Gastranaerophilales bacterium]